jgi:hypothetical protein
MKKEQAGRRQGSRGNQGRASGSALQHAGAAAGADSRLSRQVGRAIAGGERRSGYAQNHTNAFNKRIAALREENLDLKKKLGMKASEMGGAAEDLMLMTRENQALTSGTFHN